MSCHESKVGAVQPKDLLPLTMSEYIQILHIAEAKGGSLTLLQSHCHISVLVGLTGYRPSGCIWAVAASSHEL